jgi:signal recognition particle subunit SEC65
MLDRSDKLTIYQVLKESLFRDVLQKIPKIPAVEEFSMKDITEIVDEVRQEMYEQGEQYL